MKLNVWIVSALAPLTAVLVMAQDTVPAPASGTPAPETAAATPAKKASSIKKRVVLDPPAAAMVKSADVNLRGKPAFAGETLGHLQKGDTVTVLAQITLKRPKKDEPSDWAEIVIPPSIPVWVDGDYIDSATKTIKARRVHLRGGPGENYSVVGSLDKGAAIKEIKTEKGWLAIEAPTNAYAYVAAQFLEMQPPPALAVTPPPTAPAPDTQVVNVNNPAPPVAATNELVAAAPVAPAPVSQQNQTEQELDALHRATVADTVAVPAAGPASAPAVTNGTAAPRIVTREGFVRRAYNIQSPSQYELRDIQSGRLIEYLEPKAGLNFKIFLGTRVSVTGPEGMDYRWPRTPVLQVQSVDLMP
jgi:hypothetical protein